MNKSLEVELTQINEQEPRKWYKKQTSIVALLVLFFPVGLYLMFKNSGWSPKVKAAVTGVCAFYYVMLSANQPTSTPTSSASSTQTSSEQPSTMQRTLPGRSQTGYKLYLGSDDCIYVKDITEGDLARLNVTLWEYKDVLKQETGKSCVFVE